MSFCQVQKSGVMPAPLVCATLMENAFYTLILPQIPWEIFSVNVPSQSMPHLEIENLPETDVNTMRITMNVPKRKTRAKTVENAGINPLDILTANAKVRALKVSDVKGRSNQALHPPTSFHQTPVPVVHAIIFKWRSIQPT